MNALIGAANGDGGIPDSALLGNFAEAAIGRDADELATVRAELVSALGNDVLVDASAIVATFNAIDRVADSTCIPIDEARVEVTEDLREQLGINAFPSRDA